MPSPEETTRLSVNLSKDQHRRLKILAAEHDLTVTSLVTVLLQQLLDEPGVQSRTVETAQALT